MWLIACSTTIVVAAIKHTTSSIGGAVAICAIVNPTSNTAENSIGKESKLKIFDFVIVNSSCVFVSFYLFNMIKIFFRKNDMICVFFSILNTDNNERGKRLSKNAEKK